MMDHWIDVEFGDLYCTLTLPDYFPLEAVLDLLEYLTPPMRLFKPMGRPGNKIGFVLPPSFPIGLQEKFVKLLHSYCSCWFRCYPVKLAEWQAQNMNLGQRLKVVPTEI